ncbi:hypothetical protein CKAN_01375000 [Cinnamomum micranthum f. kanehirae]|uniref:Uncharacterized protein n=1 Tax=Cinnamomum micranthum f. kanehirae TaxID=337451 RepID=A0A443P2C4_9MAGN|nr:hypothetical protein CKAN_01375000 [Cinnamomum micranthum f. kanehirae]
MICHRTSMVSLPLSLETIHPRDLGFIWLLLPTALSVSANTPSISILQWRMKFPRKTHEVQVRLNERGIIWFGHLDKMFS